MEIFPCIVVPVNIYFTSLCTNLSFILVSLISQLTGVPRGSAVLLSDVPHHDVLWQNGLTISNFFSMGLPHTLKKFTSEMSTDSSPLLLSSSMTSPKTSLSIFRPPSSPPIRIAAYENRKLSHPPNAAALNTAQKQICKSKPLTIKVNDKFHGRVLSFLQIPQNYCHAEAEGREKIAAVLV